MSSTPSTNDTPAPLVPDLKLQATVPSTIRRRGGPGDGVSGLVASTLRGSRTRMLLDGGRDATTSIPHGWTRFAHPDSGVYYYVNKEKRVSTSSNVLSSRICSLITDGADALRRSAAFQALPKDAEVDLVLDVQRGDGSATQYYCVSHVERRVFWLEGVGHGEVEVKCTSNRCLKSEGSKVHCIEAQYWTHCDLFPTSLVVTKDIIADLKDILLQTSADRLLVKFSTSPYDKHDLEYMLNLVKEIESDLRQGSGHAAWIIARFMALYIDGVLQSSYGQSDDFFDIEDTGSIGPYHRPVLLAILGPLFLKSPDVYASELHSFHENFTLSRWSNFVHKVDQSIRDSNLLATVLLSTNVGFLSWSDGGKQVPVNSPTPAQIMSYISIICSAGSIIIGLAIYKQYRAKGADTPLRAVVVLRRILKEPFGLERLSIICSLPYVLLMWSLIAFLASFAIIFYQDTGIAVRIPVTLALFFVLLSLFFCMFTAGGPDKEDQQKKQSKSGIREGGNVDGDKTADGSYSKV